MPHHFHPGDHVFWWKRITRAIEYPFRAEVVAVGVKRIKIAAEDMEEGPDRVIRHVSRECLQPIGMYHEKASGQGPKAGQMESWGRFTRYLEIGEDLRAVRQVDVFKNGSMLRYDRSHWVDDFGVLADARLNRNRKQGPWGWSREIQAAEFERVWSRAGNSPSCEKQVATAQMARMGAIPIWLTIKGWRPGLTRRSS
jgi:hypothetical protein